jgi:hypothetical protein
MVSKRRENKMGLKIKVAIAALMLCGAMIGCGPSALQQQQAAMMAKAEANDKAAAAAPVVQAAPAPVAQPVAPPDTDTVDQICVRVGVKLDKREAAVRNLADTVSKISDADPTHLFESKEENMAHIVLKLVANLKKSRHDACYSPDVATARAVVEQDNKEGMLLVKEWEKAEEDLKLAAYKQDAR